MMKTLTIPEKKVSISSETESALSHARLPAGISIQECSVRSSFLLNKKGAPVDAYEKTILQLFSAAAVLVPYLLVTENFSALQLTGRDVLLLLVLGIVHTGIAYALYFGSMDGLRAQTIALFSYIDPVVALFLSALLLREPLTAAGMIGAVLILGSAAFSELTAGS